MAKQAPVVGLESYSVETLLRIEQNLLKGLDLVAKSCENGTFNKVGDKGKAPPRESGAMTLWFALGVDAELRKRGVR